MQSASKNAPAMEKAVTGAFAFTDKEIQAWCMNP